MIVYGKCRLEKLGSCQISVAYVPAYVEILNLYPYTRYVRRGSDLYHLVILLFAVITNLRL